MTPVPNRDKSSFNKLEATAQVESQEIYSKGVKVKTRIEECRDRYLREQ